MRLASSSVKSMEAGDESGCALRKVSGMKCGMNMLFGSN